MGLLGDTKQNNECLYYGDSPYSGHTLLHCKQQVTEKQDNSQLQKIMWCGLPILRRLRMYTTELNVLRKFHKETKCNALQNIYQQKNNAG